MTDSLPMPITAPLTNAQRTQLLNLVRRAAKAEIMPRFRLLDTHQIGTKTGPEDLVTIADKAAEAMITRGILTMFPNALIIGEEHASDNPDIINKIAEAELCFTIDPVDGTWNYAKGLTCFGVMVSILRFGNPVFGLLYDPVMNDVIWADDQSPAMMIGRRGFKRKLSTSKGGPVENLTGYVPLSLIPEDKRMEMVKTFPRFERINSLRCIMQEMRMLTQGNADFILTAKLTPWDQPAGVVTARQAGAHVAMLDGSDYRGDLREGYMLAACNVETWGRVRDMFDFLIDKPAAEEEPAVEETRDAADA
ncbi:Inositol-1-monophosphatase [Pelagimonas phthalicica]|uniref:Inositol-1-monophosphatase n=1 Tax=Pelagimonas phthalicica TaxID=1037362 RepID=A0A238J7F6_9RHOB|nr:inositol monophosphatase [Pelagimonas phthalicica]TDS95193.1 fructose-1,6-bisphosphatase/inositol monophosphatase family enzyme [Pelagimonas phthalicica]SMX26283.1 Inositol-1-monophosphatase [Pelagimonas phthalicica]